MKYSVPLLFLFITLASCAIEEQEIQSPASRILSNRSGFPVTVTYSSSRDEDAQGTIFIQNAADTTLVGYCETGFSSGLPCVIGWIEDEHTALRVIFDNSRYIDFPYSNCRDSIITLLGNHNIAESCGHEFVRSDETIGYTLKWTFTREDYDNATPL